MKNKSTIFKGSLGLNKTTGILFISIFGIIYTIFSLEYMYFLINLCGFFISLFFCAIQNYSIHFLEDTLNIKSYIFPKAHIFSYTDIKKITINGLLLPSNQKFYGVGMEVFIDRNDALIVKRYDLKNFNSKEIKQILSKFKEKELNYFYHSGV